MGKKKQKVRMSDYIATQHLGIAHGPVDRLLRIDVGDEVAWTGDLRQSQHLEIDEPELFGGNGKGGGIRGTVEVTMGGPDEAPSPALAARVGRYVNTVPAYRGLMTMLFRGPAVLEDEAVQAEAAPSAPYYVAEFLNTLFERGTAGGPLRGFLWGSNRQTLPAVKLTTFTASKGPSGNFEVIWPDDNDTSHDDGEGEDSVGLSKLPGANPAWLIYELLTDHEVGGTLPPEAIDEPSFEFAAERLSHEKFGLNFTWVAQMEVQKYVQQILDHIRAFLFADPATGKRVLRLLREDIDYSIDVVLDPSTITLNKPTRVLQSEVINEIIVSYKDPDTDNEATVNAVNLANIAVQNGIVNPDTRKYDGVRDVALAQRIADRDLAEAATPLLKAGVTGDRRFWNLRPGDTAPLNWPELGIVDMQVRIMAVNPGGPDKPEVEFDITEDVFALRATTYVAPQLSLAAPIRQAARPLPLAIPVTIPQSVLLGSTGLTPAELDARWPNVAIGFVLDDPARAVEDIRVHGPVAEADGSLVEKVLISVPPTSSGQIDVALVPEATTTLSGDLVRSILPEPDSGDVVMIGEDDATAEIVVLYAEDESQDEWSVLRGAYDTEPGAWPLGARISDFPDISGEFDPGDRIAGAEIAYRFQPLVDGNRLALADADPVVFTPGDRAILPNRPANVQLDGQGFGGVDYSGDANPPAVITATWANRDRNLEDVVPELWDGPDVIPEAGQTVTLKIINVFGDVVNEVAGLGGTSYDITATDFAGMARGWVAFYSVRDGYESRIGPRRSFIRTEGGYGSGYGESYGR